MGNIRLAFRHLRKSPFVTLVAIASLALGIGANAAIFSLVDQMLLRPLPVAEPGRLVNFAAPGPNPGSHHCNVIGDCHETFSYPMFLDLQREQTVFTDIAAHVGLWANISAQGRTMSARGCWCRAPTSRCSGSTPTLGRLIGPEDANVLGAGAVAVLSYDYWRGALGGDPDVVSKTIIVNGQSLEIIGVAPKGFEGTALGLDAEDLRADHHAGSDQSGLGGLRQPAQLLGLPLCPAQARGDASSRPPPPSIPSTAPSCRTSRPRCRRG